MLGRYGKKKRGFVDEYGTRYEVELQKFKCSQCGEYYIERPDCFEKRKQYLRVVVDAIKTGDQLPKNTGPSKATAFRWRKEESVGP